MKSQTTAVFIFTLRYRLVLILVLILVPRLQSGDSVRNTNIIKNHVRYMQPSVAIDREWTRSSWELSVYTSLIAHYTHKNQPTSKQFHQREYFCNNSSYLSWRLMSHIHLYVETKWTAKTYGCWYDNKWNKVIDDCTHRYKRYVYYASTNSSHILNF